MTTRERGMAWRARNVTGSRRWGTLVLGGAAIVLVAVAFLVTRNPAKETPIIPSTTGTTAPAVAPPLTAGDVTRFLDEALGQQMAAQRIPAAAVAVVKEGELLVARGYGYTDTTGQEPVVPEETIFLTGSTGKLFTWTAVMQLVEEGKLDLDTDVNEYLDFTIPATYPEPITLRHLMSHSAGFEEQFYLYALDTDELVPLGVQLARTIPTRVRPPGEVPAYSNYGTALAGYLVERVTGLSFERYVEENLFAPLGMDSTSFRQPLPTSLATRRIASYAFDGEGFRLLEPRFVRLPPTGASVTPVTDMANFMIAHLEGGRLGATRILQEETAAQMHARHFTPDPRVNGFAYGFAESTLNGQRLLRHEGEVPGRGCSALMLVPAERLGLYVTYNGMCTMNTGTEIWQGLLDRYFPAPAPAPATTPGTAREKLLALAGSYRSSRLSQSTFGKSIVLAGGASGDLRVEVMGDGTLRTEGLGPHPLVWVEVEPYRFLPAGGNGMFYGSLVFHPETEGHAPRLLVENIPYRAWERVAWYETVGYGLAVAGVCAIVFLSALLLPVGGWLRHRRAPTIPRPATDLRWARRLSAAAAGLYLLFPLLFVLTGFAAMEYGVTSRLVAVLSLPLLATALLPGALYFAIRGWRDPAWGGALGRVHFGSVVLAALVFSLWLHSWNLFGFRF